MCVCVCVCVCATLQVNTVYALMPVAVKGLLGNMEGVVLRRATGKSADDVWRILMRAPGKAEQYLQVCTCDTHSHTHTHTHTHTHIHAHTHMYTHIQAEARTRATTGHMIRSHRTALW